MTRHTSYVPQLDPVRQWPCPSLGQQAGRAHGWWTSQEGARFFGAGISTWPGCWPCSESMQSPRLVGPTGITPSRCRGDLGGRNLDPQMAGLSQGRKDVDSQSGAPDCRSEAEAK